MPHLSKTIHGTRRHSMRSLFLLGVCYQAIRQNAEVCSLWCTDRRHLQQGGEDHGEAEQEEEEKGG